MACARLVDRWVEGVIPSHGFLLKSSQGNRLTFAQREWSAVAQRPVLLVTTESGPPPLRAEREPGTGSVRLSLMGILETRADGLSKRDQTAMSPGFRGF